MTNTNGWDEYKLLILHHMEENEKRHTQILERLDKIDETNVESKGQRKAECSLGHGRCDCDIRRKRPNNDRHRGLQWLA